MRDNGTGAPLLRLERGKVERIVHVCDKVVLLGLVLLTVGIPFSDVFEVLFYGGQLLAVVGLMVRVVVCERRRFWGLIAVEFLATAVVVLALGAVFSHGGAFKPFAEFLKQFSIVFIVWLILLQGRAGDEAEDEKSFSLYRVAQMAFAGFVIVSLLSSVMSLSPEVSFRDFRKELGPYAIIYLVVVRSVRNMDYLKKIVRIFFAVGLVVAFVGVGEYALYRHGDYRVKRYFLRNDIVRPEEPGQLKSPVRIQFPFGHHNRMASYLLLTAMLVLMQGTFTVKRGNQRWTVAAMVLPLSAMALTWNRGAIVGLVAGLFVFAVFTKWRYILYGVVALLALYLLLPGTMGKHFATILSPQLYTSDEGTVALRKYGWRAGIKMVKDYPFFGIGYGWRNFEKEYAAYREPEEIEAKPHSHNNFLEIAAENGLVGLGAFVIFSALLLGGLVKRCLAQSKKSPLRFTTAAFLGMLIAIHTYGLSNYSLRKTIGFVIWMLFGLTLAYLRLHGERYLGEDGCAKEEPVVESDASVVTLQ
jgi:hypothetical protein